MPPSGPTLWSSNNSEVTTIPEHGHNNNIKRNMMNNEQDDVIGSLNKVLSSVNLAGEVDGSGHSSNGGGQGQQYGAPGTAVGSQTGSWTGLSGSADPSPAPGWVAINLSFSYDVHCDGSPDVFAHIIFIFWYALLQSFIQLLRKKQ